MTSPVKGLAGQGIEPCRREGGGFALTWRSTLGKPECLKKPTEGCVVKSPLHGDGLKVRQLICEEIEHILNVNCKENQALRSQRLSHMKHLGWAGN